jgi:hypothetical protein
VGVHVAGGFHKVVHAVLSRVPSSAVAKLPPALRLQLRALSQQLRPPPEHLPTVVEAQAPESSSKR